MWTVWRKLRNHATYKRFLKGTSARTQNIATFHQKGLSKPEKMQEKEATCGNKANRFGFCYYLPLWTGRSDQPMRRILLSISFAAIMLFLFVGVAAAAPAVPRPASMGGAFVAVADDASLSLYNPAGIHQLKFGFVSAPSFQGNIGTIIDVITNLSDIDWSKIEMDAIDDIGTNLYNAIGNDPLLISPDYYFSLTSRWVGLSAAAEAKTDLKLVTGTATSEHVPVGTVSLDAEATISTGFKVELDSSLDWISFGLNINAGYYWGMTTTYDSATTIFTTEISNNAAISFDLGVLAKVGTSVQVGAVVNDLFWIPITGARTLYSKDLTSDTVIDDGVTDDTWSPEKPYVSLDLGVAFAPPDSGMTLAADLHGIEFGKGNKVPFSINFGFEQVYKPVALRFGVAFREKASSFAVDFSCGLGLVLKWFNTDFCLVYTKNEPLNIGLSMGVLL